MLRTGQGYQLENMKDVETIQKILAKAKPVQMVAHNHRKMFKEQHGTELYVAPHELDPIEVKVVNKGPVTKEDHQHFLEDFKKKSARG